MKTKAWLTVLIVGAIGFAAGYTIVQRSLNRQAAAWQAEKAKLQSELALAGNRPAEVKTIATPAEIVRVTNSIGISPEAILGQLVKMQASSSDPRGIRRVVHQFESLADAGPAALPAIRAFLARNEDLEYNVGFVRSGRDGDIPLEFAVPPSLRLGLLETVKNIGGPAAEEVLAETLKTTGRGIEVAYLARALQEMAPDKYRDLALASARELLNSPLADPSDPLGRYDRNYLYGVFAFFHDDSAASLAKSQLVQTNGHLDQVSLHYLQQTMNSNSVSLMTQLWQDPRVAADQKEPLARVALAYAGMDPQANQLWQTAINDPNLSADARRNLIEDLNETGFADPKNLTQADLPLIQNRMALIEQLAPYAMDQVNARAFQEAYKDLGNMYTRLTQH